MAPRRFSRVSFVAGSAIPSWSPDAQWIAYTGGTAERSSKVFRKRVDGSAGEEVVWVGEDLSSASDWTRDGRSLIGTDLRGEMGIYVVPLGGGEAQRIVAAPGGQYGGSLDPSGRLLAYTSLETGVDEIFVSTYPRGRRQMADLDRRRTDAGLGSRRQERPLRQGRRGPRGQYRDQLRFQRGDTT